MSGNIKVVVRCRPLNTREKTRGAVELVRMEGNQTIITKKGEKEEVKAFTFDHSYWSVDKDHPDYADQELVYNDMGKELLDHAFDGYNCCIFAYGQTGSGKSYTMMGYGEDKGIIPRTCVELFERIEDLTTPERSYQVEVSYIEIYNEKVRDLLNPGNKGNLKVREHPTIGPYVEDLSRLAVNSYKDIDHLMNEGNKARTVASTQMNATSSRSHAVFTLFLTSTRQDKKEKAARISLVDLAGSERATTTGATGVRLKEGANINKSLTTLGKVIAALADHHHKKSDHIPYRDSVLTWLLKDSLGGNSKTAMLAAISPADYDETLSTLRYADQAKKIKNKAVVNEDPNTRLIKDLKQELQALKDTLMIYAPEEVERIVQQKKMGHKMSHSQSSSSRASPMLLISPESPIVTQRGTRLLTTEQVLEQLETSEKLLEQANQTWEEKMNKTESIHREREKALEELGVIVEKNNMGVYAPKSIHLINLSEDPLMTECLMYHIKQGSTRVGKSENGKADIRLTGQEIMDDHCLFENTKGEDTVAEVTIHPRSHSVTLVNGLRIQEPKVLHHGYRIIFGSGLHHLFRFNHPEEAKRSKDKPEPEQQPEQQSKMDDLADWRFAHNEALSKFVNPTTDLDTMTDEDIQKLYYGISKVHEFRSRQRIASSDGTILDDESVTSTANGSPRTSTRFSNISTTTSLSTSRSEDMLKLEDEAKYLQVKQEMEAVMEQQKRAYESKIKRITRHLPPGTALSSDNLMVGYTSKNAAQYLVKKVVSQWRQWRYVKMAESCLVHAVVLKEANIMAKELGKDVTYQFTVVHDDVSANPVSHWESTSVLQPFTRELDPALMQEPKPCLAVQVIDHVHRVTYIWSIARIKSRLRRMRQIYDYNDRPLFAHPHFFKRDDPFYETPCPRFSLIGLARVPLRNLTLQLHADNLVDIYCRNTGQVVGQLKVLVTPIARSISRKSLKIPQESMEKYLLHIGQQQVFEIHIQEITGISESHFTQVHAQFHLSSFGNTERDSTTDKIYSTNPVSQFDKHISFDHCATLSIQINEKMMDIILNEGLTIEVYGQAQTDFLYQSVESVPTQPTDTVDVPISRRFSLDRRFSLEKSMYDGILMEERHDVLAWVQISELDAQGEYVPVPVVHEPLDIFSLRQGIQRRISLHLQHDSGKQFEWSSVESVHVNHARLVDGHGRVLETSTSSVQVPLLPQTSDCKRNGIFSIAAQGTWDSSLHNATFLNRTSSSGQYIRLTVVWHVKYDRCSSTLPFEMDIAVRIQGRDLGLFRQFFSSTPAKQVMKSSAKYVVHLKPQTTRQVCELWRLNTANKYVRGEEFIGSWKPRGVSLITDYREAKQKMVYREHVAAFRHALELARHPQAKEIRKNQTGEEEKEEHTPVDAKVLLEKVIRLWTKKFGTQEEITFNQDPPSLTPSTSTQSVKSATTNYNKDIKLVADIQQLYPSDTITKKGYLLHPKNVDEEWIKYWCVLKRPFIIIYEDNTETEEVGILNLASARVDYKSDLEKMLDRKNMFAVYTSNNAYFLEATDFDDMKDWVSKIDQFFPVDDLQGAQQ